ncbi:multicopper oxidase family protein [Streptomyces gibsoniae]|uniref:Multicopper oxidase family protein n=1 Tax=Streptomyces gibsoniae TaxID=3075529 RepID=A0ABU2TU84_9ACTN|nr:multicopper oxidase family protein [Streptomyces sp. DSM 41699]MDT0464519.1 multicopper oxidase family protein [Streptomyces sp. DSM 41699]
MVGVALGRPRGGSRRGVLAALSALAVVTGGPLMTNGESASAATAGAGHGARKVHRSAASLCDSSASKPPFFVDEVRQPPVAKPDGGRRGGGKPGRADHYTLTAAVHHTHRFAGSWPASKTLAYSTADAPMDYFGPTIVTREGRPVDVRLVNKLPPSGTPVFPTFPTTDDDNMVTLHHHGGLQGAESDGVPDPLGTEIHPGHSSTYRYPSDQAAAPLFYHDHDDGNTGPHVYAGLIGYSPQTDRREQHFGLPNGRFSKTYALLSASFDGNKQLCYSKWGDLPVVNGTIAPKQQVEPRRYLFTLLNESPARYFHLAWHQVSGTASSPPVMTVVASDQGYLRHPVRVPDLLLAPGERYRVVVDFHARDAQQWVLSNDAPAPYPMGGGGLPVPQIMRFDVGPRASSPDHSRIPRTIEETNNALPLARKLRNARLRIVQAAEPTAGNPMIGDENQPLNYMQPATETPQQGSWEVWAIRNYSPDSHPIHLHLIEQPQLIGRWHVGRWTPDGKPVPGTIGPFEPAPAYQSGPKDVFDSDPDYITAWVGTFPIEGTTVWHCHMATHEDGVNSNGAIEMMRPLVIGRKEQTQLPRVKTLERLNRLVG